MRKNIRKITVGDNYTHNIKYVKGIEYRVGTLRCTLVDIILNEKEGYYDIYVTDGKSTFIWKSVTEKPLEIEYDVNFK